MYYGILSGVLRPPLFYNEQNSFYYAQKLAY
jgi:hypothetical protein